MTKKKPSPVEAFLALPDSEKEKIWQSYDRVIPDRETSPLSVNEEVQWRSTVAAATARRRGRPKVGQGAKRVQITVEQGLLKRADAYAKRFGMTRAQLIAKGLGLAIAKPL